MKFVIITHVVHVKKNGKYFGYSPYIREMNIWEKYIDELIVVAPLTSRELTEIDDSYKNKNIDFKQIPAFNITSLLNVLSLTFKLPIIFWKIFWAMKKADHIHLRCPGNVGLIGCIVQMLFPNKIKTAKYAGNWDPKSKQPITYRMQKWILNNTFLTRNMKVLVYGDWKEISHNIQPFFTASYYEKEKSPLKILDLNETIKFIFVGTLSSGKNPLYAVKLIEDLIKKGYKVSLQLYGEGQERNALEEYIFTNKLANYVTLKGNQNRKIITNAYENSHFIVLPSKSEGWPKAIAEGMFWGCVPVATNISCVSDMLDYGNRGILLQRELEKDVQQLENILNHEQRFDSFRKKSSEWSRKYTLDLFESEIKRILEK
ncbi:glycosyltransferase [Flavobacterium anhuiense]|uniref:glycosyltransferase n=1 Tax=Flavobacterium anhuiense TaxID=459526 RepID=UPI003D988948